MSSVSWGGVTVLGNNKTGSTGGTTGAFSFGSTTPSTPTTSTSLFGSTNTNTTNAGNTPAKSAFSFSSPSPAPATTSTTSFFGTPTTSTSTQVASTFTPNHATPAQAALQAQMHAQQLQEVARIESSLATLHAAYSSTPAVPGSSDANANLPFQYIFYDPIDQHPHLHQVSTSHQYPPRPTHVSDQKWAEAIARNPNSKMFTPISLIGADALSTRISTQQEKAKMLQSHTQKLIDTLKSLRQSRISSMQKIQHYQQENRQLQKKMLHVMRKVEILRCMNLPLQPAERDLGLQLANLAKQVNLVSEQCRSVQEMSMEYKHQKEKEMESNLSGGVSRTMQPLSEEDKKNIHIVLQEQTRGLEHLVKMVKKDARDMEIMKSECVKRFL